MRSEEVYNRAREIAIEEAELGEGPEGWPAWADEIRYTVTEADEREASQLFGELEDALDVAEFEAWLSGLQSERFRQVSQAIDVLRSALVEYRADLGVGDVLGRIG